MLLPFAQDIKGRVYSSLGPLKQASVNIALADWEAATRTGSDGAFQTRLHTGLSLTLVGSQALRVAVTPEEPWHRADSLTVNVLMVNLANIAGLLLVLVIPALAGARRWKARIAPATAPTVTPVVPTLIREELPPQPLPEEPRGPRAILLALYRGVLRLVARLTAMMLRPSHTLREYAHECAPGLGPLAGYFQDFTGVVERLLYSRYGCSEKDLNYGRQLAVKIEEAVKPPELRAPGGEPVGGVEAEAKPHTGGVTSANPWRQSTTWLWVLLLVTVAYFAAVLIFLLPLMMAISGRSGG